jgi:hypothetical protein
MSTSPTCLVWQRVTLWSTEFSSDYSPRTTEISRSIKIVKKLMNHKVFAAFAVFSATKSILSSTKQLLLSEVALLRVLCSVVRILDLYYNPAFCPVGLQLVDLEAMRSLTTLTSLDSVMSSPPFSEPRGSHGLNQ